MKLSLSKALKQKNKLVKEISKALAYVSKNNSQSENTPRAYSVKEKLAEAQTKTQELVELKTRIHLANTPVWHLIFRLSEVKSLISNLQGVSTHQKAATAYDSAITAEVSTVEKDELIKALEAELESIQDKLDHHNHSTVLA